MNDGRQEFQLSALDIAMFEQCPKRLWLSTHRPDRADQSKDAASRHLAYEEVRETAKGLLPERVMIKTEASSDGLAASLAHLTQGQTQPLFGGIFIRDGVLARTDILERDPDGRWQVIDIRSSTQLKDHFVPEIATKIWVLEGQGITPVGAVIRHIDGGFVLERPGAFESLFTDADVTRRARPIVEERSETVASARTILANAEPHIEPGDHCETPNACPFSTYCEAQIPMKPEWSVDCLPNGGGKRWRAKGILNLLEIDPALLANALHKRVFEATMTGIPFHDRDGARAAMASWEFPRVWLDFETIGFPVPRWIGTRPYQAIPFQFSAHIEAVDGAVEHRDFLSVDGRDPRRACAEALLEFLPDHGTVIAYNASFERRCLLDLREAFPDLADGLNGLSDRLVDLLPVARACWYHRDQRGSWSIKAVLPTLAPDLAYSDLEVKDGRAAQDAYLKACAALDDTKTLTDIAAALRSYCCRDTEAMMVVARRLTADP